MLKGVALATYNTISSAPCQLLDPKTDRLGLSSNNRTLTLLYLLRSMLLFIHHPRCSWDGEKWRFSSAPGTSWGRFLKKHETDIIVQCLNWAFPFCSRVPTIHYAQSSKQRRTRRRSNSFFVCIAKHSGYALLPSAFWPRPVAII